ncbi:MAG TPA: CpsD/CapB family tyrosine-protein kinase [Vicinamibacterales bacterium]|nr:CpsD/CapB family tyrosine-protein kinase [Vicinamibacterales bacterium]
MALFEKPFRYVPPADPAEASNADVAVVDSVMAADPAPASGASLAPEPEAPSAAAAAPAVEPAPDPVAAVPAPAAVPPSALITPAPRPSAIVTVEEHGLRPAGEPGALVEFSRIVPRETKTSGPLDMQRLINVIDESDPVLDQLRSLAASLHQARTGRELKVIAVTSSVSGEGKTLLAANLALTLTRSYMRQVLMIDADLRRPNLHRLFGTPSNDGIRGALDAVREGRPVSVQEVAPRLALLPAGKPVRDPISVLASDAMQRLVASATSAFDWVIVDTPPVGMLPDVGLLSTLSDAVLLVVEAGRARYDLVQRTVESIGADRIFGVVLNKVPEHEIVSAYGMHYYAPYR